MDPEHEDARDHENSQSSVEMFPHDTSSGTWSVESDDCSCRTLLDDDDTQSISTLLDSYVEYQSTLLDSDTWSISTLLDSDDDDQSTLLNSDEESNRTLVDSDDDFQEESFLDSQVSLSNEHVVSKLSTCCSAEKTSETFALKVLDQEKFAGMKNTQYIQEEEFIDSQFSLIAVSPCIDFSSCWSAEETQSTFVTDRIQEECTTMSQCWQQPQEPFSESQMCLYGVPSSHSVLKCLYMDESSETFSLNILEQEQFAVMLQSSYLCHEEERFLDSQFSITNRPFLGVSYCLKGVETPGTFDLVIKEQEHMSYMLDSHLLIFDKACLDSWNTLQPTFTADVSPSFEMNEMSDFEILEPLLQESPRSDFQFDTEAQQQLFQSLDSTNFDMNFDFNHNDDQEDFVEPPKTTKRKKKSSDGKIKKKYKSGPLRPFTPFSGSNFRMWNYGCPEPMNKTQLTIHQKFMDRDKRPKNISYRCYYCILYNQACDSAPGNGKCSKCIEKSSAGKQHEIICMFDEFTFKER